MTKVELKGFSKALTSRRAELADAGGNRDALTIVASADELDRIQDAGNRDWAMGNLERRSHELREVETAFQRIAAGAFGTCVNCEGAISPKRLAALPWASLCIYCQELADRRQETSPDGMDAGAEIAA